MVLSDRINISRNNGHTLTDVFIYAKKEFGLSPRGEMLTGYNTGNNAAALMCLDEDPERDVKAIVTWEYDSKGKIQFVLTSKPLIVKKYTKNFVSNKKI